MIYVYRMGKIWLNVNKDLDRIMYIYYYYLGTECYIITIFQSNQG